jgi:hypothetical protein
VTRTERLRQITEQAKKSRTAVEAACPVPITTRLSLGALDPEIEGPRYDSSDVDGRISVGVATSLNLEALPEAGFVDEATWFEVARTVLAEFPPSLDDASRVWVSDMGSLYHRYDDCQVMWSGKRTARDEGMKVHGIHSMKMEDARHGTGGFGYTLKPCKVCL